MEDIAAVDGIDVYFIGPSDLSQSMGHPGNPKAPPVADAIASTLVKIMAAGKTPGMPASADAVQHVVTARHPKVDQAHIPCIGIDQHILHIQVAVDVGHAHVVAGAQDLGQQGQGVGQPGGSGTSARAPWDDRGRPVPSLASGRRWTPGVG